MNPTNDGEKLYKIHFTQTSLKEFQKLGDTVKEQFKKKLKALQKNPHIASAKLSDELAGCYKIKLRSSDYRLVYQVKDDVLVIVVIGMGKCQNFYKAKASRLPIEIDDNQ